MNHAVAINHSFLRAAEKARMTEEEIESIVDFLSQNPMAGDPIPGTGGCRKVRIAG
jgi:hypothetical protein